MVPEEGGENYSMGNRRLFLRRLLFFCEIPLCMQGEYSKISFAHWA